jgi:CRP-like cAMP-binding protein
MRSQEQQLLIGLLRSITEIPDTEIEKVLAIFRPVQFCKNEFILRAGEMPDSLGFLTSGIVRLYYISDSGQEFTKTFCVKGDFVASYSSLVLGEPSSFFIQAIEDSSMLVADYTDYERIADQHPCWAIVHRKVVEMLYIKKEKRESSLLLEDAQTRYLNFLKEYPGLEERIKQRYIASYLGITPVSLSRIRARLRMTINLG